MTRGFAIAALSALLASCTSDSRPPALTVRIGTDFGCRTALFVRAALYAGSQPGPAATPVITNAWVHGGTFASTEFPLEWRIDPSDAAALAGTYTLVVDGVPDAIAGYAGTSLRTVRRFDLHTGQPAVVDAYLASRCVQADLGCTSVDATHCTRSIVCEERMQTCGPHGACIDIATSVSTPEPRDAGTDGGVIHRPEDGGSCPPGFVDGDGCAANGCETEGLLFEPIHAFRLLDTRTDGGPLSPAMPRCVTATDATGAALDADAIVARVTTVNERTVGALAARPGCEGEGHTATTNSFGPDRKGGSTFVVTPRFTLSVSTDTDAVIDVVGLLNSPSRHPRAGNYYHPLAHVVRVLDTRGTATSPSLPLAADVGRTVTVRGQHEGSSTIPDDAVAVRMTATVLDAPQPGFLIIASDDEPDPLPSTSVNFFAGDSATANVTRVLSPAMGGFVVTSQLTACDVVIDVHGYFSPRAVDENGQGLFFYRLGTPTRLVDTRSPDTIRAWLRPDALQPPETVSIPFEDIEYLGEYIPRSARVIAATGILLNHDPFAGWGRATPASFGEDVRDWSFRAGTAAAPGAASTGVDLVRGSDGTFRVAATRSVDVVVDAYGYFAP